MAQDGNKASDTERLEREIARTRHDLAETWTAFRAKLPGGGRSGSRANAADPPPDMMNPSLAHAGGKPRLATTSRSRSGSRRLPASAWMAGLAGLALVLPRITRKRRAPR